MNSNRDYPHLDDLVQSMRLADWHRARAGLPRLLWKEEGEEEKGSRWWTVVWFTLGVFTGLLM